MTWPPTRPVRRRLFGVVFLAVWVAGMYLCWVQPRSSLSWDPTFEGQVGFWYGRLGFTGWVSMEYMWSLTGSMAPTISFDLEPRGLAAALIMTIVSSLILCVAWRTAVNAFTCAAGTCDACGYDLTGLAQPRCPECGTEVGPRHAQVGGRS